VHIEKEEWEPTLLVNLEKSIAISHNKKNYIVFLFHLNSVKSPVRYASCAFANIGKSYFLATIPRKELTIC